MKMYSLYSGSEGNATLIESGGCRILIDCGKSCRTLCRALAECGVKPETVDALFITHEHSDHISAAEIFAKKYKKPIHITAPSAPALGKYASAAAVVHGLLYEETVGDMRISSVPLPHDSAAHVGYVITASDGDSAAVATDMGYITEECVEALRGRRHVLLESNHDKNMLVTGSYPYSLKRRILSRHGHLSNAAAAKFAVYLASNGAADITLAHLSVENNTPALALEASGSAREEAGLGDFPLRVAGRASVVEIV
jgi:phosphoribosyl 1,2-cyclic phosphodiesterase